MTVIHKCAWCQRVFSPPTKDVAKSLISHGLCESCAIDLEYKRIPLYDFLNKIPFPVLVADYGVYITTLNKAAEKTFHKNLPEIQNHLGGEVIECVYSDLPGGCGHTEHCSACSLRNIVMKTHETNENQKNVLAIQYLKTPTGNKQVELLLSTQKVGDVVLVEIKSINPIPKND